jgi:uncharacterized protein YndB with AHSA1/START domain
VFSYTSDRQADRKVSVTKEVAVPAEAVFDLLADPAKHPLLDGSGTVQASRGPAQRLALGSSFALQMRDHVPYRIVNTVVEFEDGRRIAWRHFSGHRWIWQLEPLEDGRTRVTETFDWSTAHTPALIELLGYPQRNERGMVATLERIEQLAAGDGEAAGGQPATDSRPQAARRS